MIYQFTPVMSSVVETGRNDNSCKHVYCPLNFWGREYTKTKVFEYIRQDMFQMID